MANPTAPYTILATDPALSAKARAFVDTLDAARAGELTGQREKEIDLAYTKSTQAAFARQLTRTVMPPLADDITREAVEKIVDQVMGSYSWAGERSLLVAVDMFWGIHIAQARRCLAIELRRDHGQLQEILARQEGLARDGTRLGIATLLEEKAMTSRSSKVRDAFNEVVAQLRKGAR